METARPNLALLIDYENVGADARLDISQLFNLANARGRPIIKRAYADWARFENRKQQLARRGVELIELPAHGQARKNAADIRLVVDAIEIALSLTHVNGFVIASGDSDFTPMLSKLRELGKHVIVASTQDNLSALLEAHCDELVQLKRQEPANTRTPKPKQAQQPPPKAAAEPKQQTQRHSTEQFPRDAAQLLRQALDALAAKDTAARCGRIKPEMRRFDPKFDEARYGFKRFSDFLQAAAAANKSLVLRREKAENNDFVLRRKDTKDTLVNKPLPAPVDHGTAPSKPAHNGKEITLMPLIEPLLASGPMLRSNLAMALKRGSFRRNDAVSASGLYLRIGRLVRSGALDEQSIDRHSVVSLPE